MTGSEEYPHFAASAILSTLVTIVYYAVVQVLTRRVWTPRHLWLKQSILTITIMLAIGTLGKTNEIQHLELATARYCAAGNYERALKIGSQYQVPSTTLTALRTYALVQTDEKTASNHQVCSIGFTSLPSHFFEYVHRDGEQNLILTPTQRRALQPYGNAIGRYDARAQRDIMLIKLLLRRDLKGFVKEISRTCNLTTTPLPRAYAEAIVLYQHITTAITTDYKDATIEANYRDFRDIEVRTPNQHIVRANTMSENYRDTYWWYYYYGDTTSQ